MNSRWRAAVTVAIVAWSAPQPAAAEPISLTTITTGVIVSLIIQGAKLALETIVDQPDLMNQKLHAVHVDIREVHQSVLESQGLIIDLSTLTSRQIEKLEENMSQMEARLKDHTRMINDYDRVERLIAATRVVDRQLRLLADIDDENERKVAIQGLWNFYRDMEMKAENLTLVGDEIVRAAGVMAQIAFVRTGWRALNTLPHGDTHRTHFVRRAGMLLEAERTRGTRGIRIIGSLTDLIESIERHAVAVDRYLSLLSDPCALVWKGQVSIEEYDGPFKKTDTTVVRARKVSVSVLDRPPVYEWWEKDQDLEGSLLTRHRELEWKTKTAEIEEKTIRFDHRRTPRDFKVKLNHLHARAFGCEWLERLSKERKYEKTVEKRARILRRAGDKETWLFERLYEDTAKLEEVIGRRKTCEWHNACREYWKTVHLRREIESVVLATLYHVRSELNRTLEWLAMESVEAECTYLRSEPRICVFEGEAVIWPPEPKDEIAEVGGDKSDASQVGRWLIDAVEQDGSIGREFRLRQNIYEREHQVRWLKKGFDERVREVESMEARTDQLLRDATKEAAKKAWVLWVGEFVIQQMESVLQDQIKLALSAQGGGTENPVETPDGWTVAVVKPEGSRVGSAEIPTLVVMEAPRNVQIQGFTSKISQSIMAPELTELSGMQKLALYLPQVPQGLVNVSAGYGDGFTLGLTKHINKFTGGVAVIDENSREYGYGYLSGYATQVSIANYKTINKLTRGALRISKKLAQKGSRFMVYAGRTGLSYVRSTATRIGTAGRTARQWFRISLPWESRVLVPAVGSLALKGDATKPRDGE